MIYIVIYHFYLKELKLINALSLHVICTIKKNYVVYIRALKPALMHGLKTEKGL